MQITLLPQNKNTPQNFPIPEGSGRKKSLCFHLKKQTRKIFEQTAEPVNNSEESKMLKLGKQSIVKKISNVILKSHKILFHQFSLMFNLSSVEFAVLLCLIFPFKSWKLTFNVIIDISCP